jgi:hypothetical protein
LHFSGKRWRILFALERAGRLNKAGVTFAHHQLLKKSSLPEFTDSEDFCFWSLPGASVL